MGNGLKGLNAVIRQLYRILLTVGGPASIITDIDFC